MEKLNIAEILRHCPKGMELDCTMYEDVHFDCIDNVGDIINCYIQDSKRKIGISFSKYGCYSNTSKSKCVIFPKGKTSWEGFQRPFKDGDIVFYNDTIAIFKEWGDETLFRTYVTKYLCCDSLIDTNVPLFGKGVRKEIRFATEEEKQKLFDAIKENGYKWNLETKTLEKMIKPKFKVGDKIVNKKGNIRIISKIIDDEYHFESGGFILFRDHDYWELVSVVPKFKVGDRVKQISAHTVGIVVKVDDKGYYIDYPKVEGVCFISFMLEKDYELTPNKFDVNTLKPFESRVLVRSCDDDIWKPAIWGIYNDVYSSNYPYITTYGATCQCIPFEGNEHLLGTTNKCDSYFKTWK